MTGSGSLNETMHGPTLAECRATYSNASWAQTAALAMPMQGYQAWTVPATGTYEITAVGARGGMGQGRSAGRGRSVTANFALTQGEVLLIAVGQPGRDARRTTYQIYAGGGGGGSFVARGDTVSQATPIVVAGGGGGTNAAAYGNYKSPGSRDLDAQHDNAGDVSRSATNGSSIGNGASVSQEGATYPSGTRSNALSFRAGLTGGYHSFYQTMGGFGGGGAPFGNNGAGGGGFTGGAGGMTHEYQGEGGGSFIAPSSLTQRDNGAIGMENGSVTVRKL